MLWIALHFPGLPPGELETLAAWACQFTPRVVAEPPQALALEVEGSLRYFGGREGLVSALQAGLGELGLTPTLAVATTARAALWRARGGGVPLAEVPIALLDGDDAFFASIGVATIGELATLPREGLARRCGQRLLDELDRAFGRLPEAPVFFSPPERFAASLELPAPVAEVQALVFGARRLLLQLEGLLAVRHAGIRALTFHFSGQALRVAFASPTRDATRMTELLRERLGTLALARPVEAIAIEAADFEPLAGASRPLFGERGTDGEDWARLVERLQARLGRDAVFGISPYPDHRPEHAWRRVEPGDWDPHEFVQPGPRPTWLLEKPRQLAENTLTGGRLVLLAGPERIACGWWDGDETRRDYFVAALGGATAWIYREDGAWWLHGFFA